MLKKILSLVMILCITMTSFTTILGEDSSKKSPFQDVKGHWAQETISYFSRLGVSTGYGDNTFKPNNPMTQSEFMTVLNKVLGLKSDVNRNQKPFISRQEAALMIANTFQLTTTTHHAMSYFLDAKAISPQYIAAIEALFEGGYIKGNAHKRFEPTKALTRAEAFEMLSNVVGTLYNQGGTYTKDAPKNVLINTTGVVLKNMTIAGDLFLAQGIGEGDVTLDHVVVKGRTIVQGGGEKSIIVQNTQLQGTLIVKKIGGHVRVFAKGDTNISDVQIYSGAKLEESLTGGLGFGNVEVYEMLAGETLTLDGDFQSVQVDCTGSSITLTEGAIETLTLNAASSILGQGKIKSAVINSSDVTMAMKPEAVVVKKGVEKVIIDGKDASIVTPTSDTTPASPWSIIWQDEFNGTQIDASKWSFVEGGGGYGNNELQNYTNRAENARIENGGLVIEAREETYGGNAYTSAKLITKDKAAWTYGRYEIKAKMPEGQGLWPAIWMMPSDEAVYNAWPACGEIDIMELLGNQPDKVYGTIHFGNPHDQKQGSYTLSNGQTFANGYHVYTVDWMPNEIKWYIDGNLYATQNDWYTVNSAIAEPYTYPAPFDRDFYLQMNVAVGGSWPGNPDGTTTFSQKMLVDYVRVYTYNNGQYPAAGERPKKDLSNVRAPLADGNYIYNGDFDQEVASETGIANALGTDYWTLLQLADFQGVATASVENNGCNINISNEGNQTYSVQLVQTPLYLEKTDRYKVTFEAKATTNRSMVSKVGAGADQGYANYSGDQVIDLTTTKTSYSYEFTMSGDSNPKSRLEFNLGKQGVNTVWIGNVRIEKLPKDLNAARPALSSGNLIYNGTFDQGSGRMGYWKFSTNGTASATYQVPSQPTERMFMTSNLLNPGLLSSDIQLTQSNLNLENGKTYKISFEAKAERIRSIDVQVGNASNSAISYNEDATVGLTTTMKTYAVQFTMTQATDINGMLKFNLGADTAIVTLDDVVVKNILTPTYNQIEAETFNNTSSPITAITKNGVEAIEGLSGTDFASYTVNVSEAGVYAVSYKVMTTSEAAWIALNEPTLKETIPGPVNDQWIIVTNSIALEAGNQTIKIYGENVVLDWINIAPNLIQNSKMTNSANWASWTDMGGAAVIGAQEGQMKLAITNEGSESWGVGLKQENMRFEGSRTYRISFDAKSTLDRSIRITLDKLDYSKYLSKDVTLSNTLKNYTIEFTMNYNTDDKTALVFNFGRVNGVIGQAHDVYLDNVVVTEISDIQGDQVINAPMITEPVVVPEVVPTGGSIIANGSMDQGTTSWNLFYANWGPAEAAITVVEGTLKVAIANEGTLDWHVQVTQPDLTLTQGKQYTVTFKGKSTLERTIPFVLQHQSDPYTAYLNETATLTTDWKTYTYTFTMNDATDAATRICWTLGGSAVDIAAHDIYIDDVSVVELP